MLENNFDKMPLVSVVVITYNSSEFIIETLESIKKQTYPNIELIVSDDGSKDSTIELCNNWSRDNEKRFSAMQVITVEKNTGIPANCNRGFNASKGSWIKLIAGDDLLAEKYIEKMMGYSKNHPDCEIIHSPVIKFTKENDGSKKLTYPTSDDEKKLNKDVSSEKQFHILSMACPINAPSVIMKKSLFERNGNLDETIPNCEDWPYWLKITKNGTKFHYIDEALIYYRIHGKSTYSSGKDALYIHPFFRTEKIIFEKYIKDHVSSFQKNITEYDYFLKNLFAESKASVPTKILFRTLRLPVELYYKLA